MLSAGLQSSRPNFYICRIFFSSFTSDSILFSFLSMLLAIGVWSPDILPSFLPSFLPTGTGFFFLFLFADSSRRLEAQRERIYSPYLRTYIYPQTADTRAGRSRRNVHACMRAWSMDVKITCHTYIDGRKRRIIQNQFRTQTSHHFRYTLTCTPSMDGIKSNKNSTQVSCLVHDPLGARKDGYKLPPNCSKNFSLHSISYNNPLTLLNPSRLSM
jgi:hypothetical protein